jgi:RNA polymerase primary sigma factor
MAERFEEAQDLFPETISKRSILDISLLEFVLSCPEASVRLVNTIRSAAGDDKLPFACVRDYIHADSSATAQMLAIPGLGRTSLAELDSLVSSVTSAIDGGLAERSPYIAVASVGLAEAFEVPMFDFLQHQPRVSTRLFNAIRGAVHEGECPFANVGEYLAAGGDASVRLCKIPNLGANSAAEFDGLVRGALANGSLMPSRWQREPLKASAIVSKSSNGVAVHDEGSQISRVECVSPDEMKVSLFEFLQHQPRVSTRLLNAIRCATDDETCPFKSVAEYLTAGRRAISTLSTLPNLGANSATEFDRLVRMAIASGSLLPVHQHSDTPTDFPSINSILEKVFSAFDMAEKRVVVARLQDGRTLEQIAVEWEVTRERIRQIEVRALRRLSPMMGMLRTCTATIHRFMVGAGKLEVSLVELAEMGSCKTEDVNLLLQLIRKMRVEGAELFGRLGLSVYLTDMFIDQQDWSNVIRQALLSACWPVRLDELAWASAQVPRCFLKEHLCQNYSAEIEGSEFKSLPQLSTHDMCIAGLLRARRPLHLSDLRAMIVRSFGHDIPEHTIAAHVGRSKEIAICDPGTYVHYANITYPVESLKFIRRRVFHLLSDHGTFISSKVIFDRLFVPIRESFPENFNHYLMMGFVQDDERFVTKRGNMIGLATFDLNETYISLEDEVRNLVLEQGPISIRELMIQLSDTRKLCNDTGIRLILSQTPSVVRVGPRTFDSIVRYFRKPTDYEDYVLAIKVCLLLGPKGSYALAEDLNALGLTQATLYVVESLLGAIDHSTVNNTHSLVSVDQELSVYRAIAQACFDEGSSRDELVRRLSTAVVGARAEKLSSFDRRFCRLAAPEEAVVPGSELGSILSAFGF